MKGTLDASSTEEAESSSASGGGRITIYLTPYSSVVVYNYSRNYTYNVDKTIATEIITGRDATNIVVNFRRDYTYVAGSLTQIGIWVAV